MANLDFICSSGIGTLVMAYSQLKAIGKSISLVNLKPPIRKVFEVSLLHNVFDIK
jgi:anti-anti-sigma factor